MRLALDTYLTYLAQRLTPARMQHSLGVMQVMDTLAPVYGLDPIAAHIAGLVHDAGKELSRARMVTIAQAMHFPLEDPGDRDPLYLHGPCSAYVAQHEMGINDLLVLEAIFRHSYVGDGPARSPVFCWCLRFADMLEPGRDWDALRNRLQPLVFAGRMGEAAHEMMDWLVPFLESLDVIPHPSQRALQRKLALLFAGGANGVPNDQLPV
jgi:predicted HD superfamily hydrolase involved in NAD metabolism